MPRGGKREGAGRPVGTLNPNTISKIEAREAFRAVVMEHMREMLDAQVKHAKGLSYLVVRNARTGKFEKVTEERMNALLSGTEESSGDVLERLEVWEKDPSVQAFTDLMNRALDKPIEPVELTGADRGPLRIIVELPDQDDPAQDMQQE